MHYVGARTRLEPTQLRTLDRSWVVQPKVDGAYCLAHLDDTGRIAALVSRRGKPFARSITSDLIGCRIGSPRSILVGELEAHTEAGNRAATTRGYRCLHLFDALVIAGRDLASRPYRHRRDSLLRDRAQLELAVGSDRPWAEDESGNAHDPGDGRFTRRVPRSWRRAPIVPQVSGHRAETAWCDWVERDGGEGLVAVALDAPAGKRGSKRKVKATASLDCVVIDADDRCLSVHWVAAGIVFAVGRREGIDAAPGDVVEVAHDGHYERTGLPRFPRLVRVRFDKVAA